MPTENIARRLATTIRSKTRSQCRRRRGRPPQRRSTGIQSSSCLRRRPAGASRRRARRRDDECARAAEAATPPMFARLVNDQRTRSTSAESRGCTRKLRSGMQAAMMLTARQTLPIVASIITLVAAACHPEPLRLRSSASATRERLSLDELWEEPLETWGNRGPYAPAEATVSCSPIAVAPRSLDLPTTMSDRRNGFKSSGFGRVLSTCCCGTDSRTSMIG